MRSRADDPLERDHAMTATYVRVVVVEAIVIVALWIVGRLFS